jgi:hypothetical protein
VHQAANGVVDSYGVLVDLLEAIEHFLKRLDIYTVIPLTPAMDELVVKIMVELLSTLGSATKHLNQGRSGEGRANFGYLVVIYHLAGDLSIVRWQRKYQDITDVSICPFRSPFHVRFLILSQVWS